MIYKNLYGRHDEYVSVKLQRRWIVRLLKLCNDYQDTLVQKLFTSPLPHEEKQLMKDQKYIRTIILALEGERYED